MAYIKFKDGRRQLIPDQIARNVWLGKYGYAEMDEAQETFARQVADITLSDYMHAPDEYVRANLMRIIPSVLNTWLVDTMGRPARPQTRQGYIFAEKWGLWANGKPTALVIDSTQQMTLV